MRIFLYLRNLCWLFIAGFFTACTDASSFDDAKVSIIYQNDDVSYVAPAITDTLTAFVQRGRSSPINQIPSDILNFSGANSIDHKIHRTRQAGVRIATHKSIARETELFGSMSLSTGQTHFSLPNGAGILVEQINLRFHHLSIDSNVGIRRDIWSSQWAKLSIEMAAGLHTSIVRSRISSPVLLARHTGIQNLPYVSVGTKLGVGAEPEGSINHVTIGADWIFYPQSRGQVLVVGLSKDY